MEKLESIHIEICPLNKIPLDLRRLTNLKYLKLINTNISPLMKDKFLLPKNCACEIIKKNKLDLI